MTNPQQRLLANLIIDASIDDANNSDSGLNFKPTAIVTYMHEAPRFGHSNRVGILASSNSEHAMEYANGLKQFTLFVLIPFVLWALILLAFKFLYGSNKVGCAAGGQIIDIRKLSKQGVPRKTRKQYIVRNWRIQATYQIVAIAIPTITVLLMRAGWKHMDTAYQEVQETLNDMESWSYKGHNIVRGLQTTKNELQQHVFVQQAVRISNHNQTTTVFDEWCPHQKNSSLAFLQDSFRQVQTFSLLLLNDDYSRYVPNDTTGFQTIQAVAQHVEASLDWFMDHDWTFKLLLMLLNVINFLLLLICFIFSKNNIIHPPTRAFTTWLLLPTFLVLTLIFMAITAVAGLAALFNADFCSGGEDGSPQGTFHDAILSMEHGSLDYSREIDGAMEVVYDSFVYYSNGCLTAHPLAFLEEFSNRIDEGVAYMTQLSGAFEDAQNETFLIDTLSNECGADVSFLPETLGSLKDHLQNLQDQIHAFVDLTSCSRVSPIIRRITHGAVCDESAKAFTWIWASCFSLLVCCFTLLTVRSALFNSIKKGKSRDKKSTRVVEKEFEEYKEYMAEYYGDEVGKWKVEGTKKKTKMDHIEFDLGSQFIQRNPTFDTETTSPDSERGGIFKFENSDEPSEESKSKTSTKEQVGDDENSFGSSYESCSDDSRSEHSEDDKSAFISFFVETKSMARHSLQNVRDMGSVIGDNISTIGGSVIGGSVMGGRGDDGSVLSSFSSKASSLARQAVHNARKLKPLLLRGHNQDDSASIDDESLFLSPMNELWPDQPSSLSPGQERKDFQEISSHQELPKTASRRSTRDGVNIQGRHPISSATTRSSTSARRGVDGILRLITPTSDDGSGKNSKRAKTPMAPKKPIRFLSRTTEYSQDEIQPLTPNRTPGSNSNVQPLKLRLSPYLSAGHRSDSNDSAPYQRRQGRRSRYSRTRVSLDDEIDGRERSTRRSDPPASPPRRQRFFKGGRIP